MIARITGFAVTRWQATLIVFALLAALGIQAFLAIPRSVDPHFPIPVVVIVAIQPGADPADMEQTVAKPIEEVLQGLDGIDRVQSRATDGQAVVTAEFAWSTDPEKDYDEVVREVNAIRAQLPQGLQRLEFRKVRTTESAVVQFALVSDTASFRRMEKVARDLRDSFTRVPGVRGARIWGLPTPEMRVAVDLGRLAELRLPVSAVTDALRAGGADLPAGAVSVGDQRFNVRAGGAFRTVEELRDTPLRAGNGSVVRVGDVAQIGWASPERTHVTRWNGKRAIWLTVTQKDRVNVLDVQRGVMAAAERARPFLPPDIALVAGFDQSRDIADKLGQLGRDFALALALVLITLLPLGLRASLVVMISVPLSLAIGVLAMWLADYTLNQLVIAGFILALGLLVDDSIVVVENIARRLRGGLTRGQAALAGTSQIAVAVLGCTGVLIFAFLPLVFLPEGAGKFTRGLPLAVIATVAASLVVSLTIVPFLASRILPRTESAHGNRILQWVEGGIHRLYAPVLHWALERPWRALGASMALCAAAIGLVPIIGTSLFPSADTPYFLVEIEAPEGAETSQTDRAVRFVEAVLAGEPGVTTRLANIGRGNPQVFYNVREIDQRSNIGAVLGVMDRWDPDAGPAMIGRIRARFAAYPDARITVTPFQNGAPIAAPIAWTVYGPDLAELKRLAGAVEAALKDTPGARDVRNPLALDRIDLDLGLDTGKAALLGVAPGAARRVARLALAGEPAGRFRDAEGDSYDVVVRLPMGERHSIAALEQIHVPTTAAPGAAIPLAQIARPRLSPGPAQITRDRQQRSVQVTANVQLGALTSRVSAASAERIARITLPPGYSIAVGGEAEARARSFSGLGGIILLTVFGIMGVLVLEFGRFKETAVVAGVIPLGLFGGLVALWANGLSLSYTAIIGFVALIGIEIKNSILLVDFTAQLRAEGMALRPAIERAGEVRFLPVLLTSVTAIGGLLPLALSGSGLYAPLAWVIIGGLVSSTLMSRIVTPVMYLLIARGEEPAGGEQAGGQQAVAPAP